MQLEREKNWCCWSIDQVRKRIEGGFGDVPYENATIYVNLCITSKDMVASKKKMVEREL